MITEEQYETITDTLTSDDFYPLTDIAYNSGCQGLYHQLLKIHELSKKALDYRFDDETHDDLNQLLEEIDEATFGLRDTITALEKIEEKLSDAEQLLSNELYREEFDDEEESIL